MPRLERLPFVPFGWYYVSLRSLPGRKLVDNDSQISSALMMLRQMLRKNGVRLHAGYLAECELHLALQAGEVPLSAVIGGFQHNYASAYNRMRGEQGSLFGLHHHVLLIQHEQWLVPLVHFIHWIRRLTLPADSTGALWWSSDAMYRGKIRHDWLTTNVVLRMLSRKTASRRAPEEAYRMMMDQAPASEQVRLLSRGPAEDRRILGDKKFIADVGRSIGRTLPVRKARINESEARLAHLVAQFIERFHSLCGERLPAQQATAWRRLVTFDTVRAGSRKHPLPAARALIVSHLIDHQFVSPGKAAAFFGRGRRTVSPDRRARYKAMCRKWFDSDLETLLDSGGSDNCEVGKGSVSPARLRLEMCATIHEPVNSKW